MCYATAGPGDGLWSALAGAGPLMQTVPRGRPHCNRNRGAWLCSRSEAAAIYRTASPTATAVSTTALLSAPGARSQATPPGALFALPSMCLSGKRPWPRHTSLFPASENVPMPPVGGGGAELKELPVGTRQISTKFPQRKAPRPASSCNRAWTCAVASTALPIAARPFAVGPSTPARF